MITNQLKLKRRIDPLIPTIGFTLSIIGLIMILSASQITAASKYGDSYHFFIRQLVAWLIGLGGFFVMLRYPLEKLYEQRLRFFWITIVLLLLVFLPGIGGQAAGVYRWVGFGGFSFQPSEIAKILLLIYFSAWFAAKGETTNQLARGLVPFLALLGIVTLLVGVLGKDLHTALALDLMAVVIFFSAKAPLWQIGVIMLLGLVVVAAMIKFEPYRFSRFQAYRTQNTAQSNVQSEGYHSQQALIAIGSGGWWGVGFGQGTSKYSYLPEAHTDSIFAVIAEELGFVRASAIFLAYVLLFWRGIMVAERANSRFVRYIAVGASSLIILQTLINIGGMLGALPLAGIPLPFLSYGGTSLIVSLSMLGLLTNVSRETQ